MEGSSIILFVIVAIIIIMLVRYMIKDVNTLSGVSSATTSQTIEASTLDPNSTTPNSTNFTYSVWININDWSYRYGEPKVIFGRLTQGEKDPCPSVVLGPIENNIIVSLTVYPGNYSGSSSSTITTDPSGNSTDPSGNSTDPSGNSTDTINVIHSCSVSNIPIQKWVNLIISVYGTALDIYIDGKLVRTCVLPGTANIDANAPVYLTPDGGFSGWTGKLQYWSQSSDPQTAWNIYKSGYGGSILGKLFGEYSIKLSLMEGDTEESSISI